MAKTPRLGACGESVSHGGEVSSVWTRVFMPAAGGQNLGFRQIFQQWLLPPPPPSLLYSSG